MRLKLRHRTHYAYSRPVFLEPQVLRLKPASNAVQRLVSYGLKIDPTPAGHSANIDLQGNEATVVWFNGGTDHLTLTSVCEVETLRDNPFEYLWDGPDALPLAYGESLFAALAPFRAQGFLDVSLQALADEVVRDAGGSGQLFPLALTQRLHATLLHVERATGAPLAPEETLRLGEGSCRDLSVLFLAVARACGYAGRFVSGYYAPADVAGPFELHAWPELYLPGGGWRGYDPTAGLAVADRHVALASAAQPEDAATVTGSLRGNATSVLSGRIDIDVVERPGAAARAG